MRFNTGQQGGVPVQSATLTLTPTTIQPGRILRLRLVPDAADFWDESGITWNNSPAASGLEATFSSNELVLNQPYAVDVTALVNQVGNANGIVTLHLDTTTQSAAGINNFASREHPNQLFRPSLMVTDAGL